MNNISNVREGLEAIEGRTNAWNVFVKGYKVATVEKATIGKGYLVSNYSGVTTKGYLSNMDNTHIAMMFLLDGELWSVEIIDEFGEGYPECAVYHGNDFFELSRIIRHGMIV